MVKKHTHSFFFFLILSTFYTYFLPCPWLHQLLFLREAKVMHLSLFSNLHMRVSRLKPYHQAEARRTRRKVTEEEKGSLPPARGILPWDLPGAHRGSASVWEVDRRLCPRSVWQMVTVFLSLLACMFGFLPPHFKTSLSPLALSLSCYSVLALLLVKYSRKSFGLVQSLLMAVSLFINFTGFD